MTADSTKAPPEPRADITGAEVDALLVKNNAGDAPAGMPQPYDLVARDRIVRGRMPVLDRLNERWVTDFERKLGELIRQPLEVTLQEVQLASYGNWLAALPVPTSFNLYTVKPWPRNALVAVDGKLLFALVNSYYGGTRATPKAARETLTPTEQRLNKIVIELLVDLFRRALSPVAALEFQQVQSEVNATYLNMATPSETVVVTRIEVTLKEQGGSICLLLPLSSF
jgi:flagellar motor switch protein FliM